MRLAAFDPYVSVGGGSLPPPFLPNFSFSVMTPHPPQAVPAPLRYCISSTNQIKDLGCRLFPHWGRLGLCEVGMLMAPSGRELAAEQTEGARANLGYYKINFFSLYIPYFTKVFEGCGGLFTKSLPHIRRAGVSSPFLCKDFDGGTKAPPYKARHKLSVLFY